MAPALAEIVKIWPKVVITLRLTGSGPDPAAEDLDMVLCIGKPDEPNLAARRLLALYTFRWDAAVIDLNDPVAVEKLKHIVIPSIRCHRCGTRAAPKAIT